VKQSFIQVKANLIQVVVGRLSIHTLKRMSNVFWMQMEEELKLFVATAKDI
jgi:hypothetical protein